MNQFQFRNRGLLRFALAGAMFGAAGFVIAGKPTGVFPGAIMSPGTGLSMEEACYPNDDDPGDPPIDPHSTGIVE